MGTVQTAVISVEATITLRLQVKIKVMLFFLSLNKPSMEEWASSILEAALYVRETLYHFFLFLTPLIHLEI